MTNRTSPLKLQLLRGGSWLNDPRFCRSAFRSFIRPDFRGDHVGFRVCCLSQCPSPLLAMENHRLKMIPIPAGEFTMGSSGPNAATSEKPAHRVILPEFLMSETPITQAQWREVASWTEQLGEEWDRQLDPDPSHFKGDNLPVENVSWYDAMEFCNRLSQRTGHKFTLPTEAQWEYACRAGGDTKYPWGDDINPTQANYSEYKAKSTTPVGMFPANAWSLMDMIGNVFEWVLDKWHSSYDGAPTDGSAWVDGSDDDPKLRLLRGGSWDNGPRNCRSASRSIDHPDYHSNHVGFRVCCLPQPRDPITTPHNATPHRATPEQMLRDVRDCLVAHDAALLDLKSTVAKAGNEHEKRLAAAEQRISELQAMQDARLMSAEERIRELERLQSWVPPEIADSLDSLADRLSALEGSRPAAADPASAGSLVAEACNAITKKNGINANWTPEDCARLVIHTCALWIERREPGSALAAARLLRMEVGRHD